RHTRFSRDWSSDVCSSDLTSPIRRYADLVVHRALIRAHRWGDDGLTREDEAKLAEIGEHISMTERRSMMAERDTIDRYLAAYLEIGRASCRERAENTGACR